MRLITLTTDFGTQDWFVGTLKGVILGIAPRATVVDITHGIPAGDLRAGAFALAAACRFFPAGTIHVAVVDPGVGSRRAAIAVRTARATFIGPDNGVLSWALRNETIKAIRRMENRRCFLPEISRTFHGRDVFAPVAAHLSRGASFARLGPRTSDYVRLPWPEVRRMDKGVEGEVLCIDRFGNAITNLPAGAFPEGGATRLQVCRRGQPVCAVGDCYQAVALGHPVAVWGSSGYLEIAVNGGSAAGKLGLKVGDLVFCGGGKQIGGQENGSPGY